jgi:phage/plasmid-like protein (TIGR03299 family)
MAHQILENDTIVATEKTWHGLEGELLSNINLENSKLDWLVTSKPLTYLHNGEQLAVEGFKAIVRQDTGYVLNVCKESYEIIQNQVLFDLIENALDGVKHKITCAGSLFNNRKAFISVTLESNQDYVVNRDQFQNYLTFTTSHDGSLALCVYDTSIRVVCNNTLQMSLNSKGKLDLRVMHTKGSQAKIANMAQVLETTFEKRDEFYSAYADLMLAKIDEQTAYNSLVGFVNTSDKVLSTKAKNIADSMFDLFQSGKGNAGNTKADLLNGVTEYYTHNATDNLSKSLQSNEFGSYAKKKMEFFDNVVSDDFLNNLVKKGEYLLNNAEVAA